MARVVQGGVRGGPGGQRGGLLVRARPPQAVQQAGHGGRVVEGGVGGRVPGQQRGGLLVRARLPQAGQQAGHAARVVEGGVRGGPGGQRGGLLVRARPPQAVQQAGHGGRVVEGGVGGRVPGQQRGGLLVRARLPQAVQQAGHAVRVIQGGVRGGPVRGAGVRAQAGRRIAEVEGGAEVTGCGGVLMQVGSVPVQAADVGSVTERGLVAGRGVRDGRGPELRREDLAGAVRPAMLVQVVREPVQRPRDSSHAAGLVSAVAGGAAGRAGADAGQWPAGALARDGGVGQGLFQPVLAQPVPLGLGQVPRRGSFQEGLRQARSHA